MRNAEFGAPQWLFGLSTYAFTSADAIIYSFTEKGMWYLGRLDTRTLSATDYAVEFSSLSGVRATANTIVLRCSSATTAPAITTVDVSTGRVSSIKYAILPESFLLFESYFSEPIPNRGRRGRARFLLSSQQSGLAGTPLGKAALDSEEPWRAYGGRQFGTSYLRCNFGPAAALPFSM